MGKIRAGVFLGVDKYDVLEFPIPEPPVGGMVLQVEAVGLCGSDLAQLAGDAHVPGETLPVVPGHEITGRIYRKHASCQCTYPEGTRVAVNQVFRCGNCPRCMALDPNCDNLRVYGYSFGLDDGAGLWGGYGEYMCLLPGTHLAPLPDSLDAVETTIFEPISSGLNWLNSVRLAPGDNVVIQGPGHMGLAITALARLMGAGRIIVTGTSSDSMRLEAALAVGADAVIDIDSENVEERVASLTNGEMADVIVDVAPNTTATIPLAVTLARQGGRILLAGLKHFKTVDNFVSDMVVLKGLSIVGGAGMTKETHVQSARLIQSGRLPIDKLRGAVYGLDQLDDALALLARKKAGQDAIRISLQHQHK